MTLLNIHQVAEKLNLCVKTCRQVLESEGIKPIRFGKRAVRWSDEQIEAWLADKFGKKANPKIKKGSDVADISPKKLHATLHSTASIQ